MMMMNYVPDTEPKPKVRGTWSKERWTNILCKSNKIKDDEETK